MWDKRIFRERVFGAYLKQTFEDFEAFVFSFEGLFDTHSLITKIIRFFLWSGKKSLVLNLFITL